MRGVPMLAASYAAARGLTVTPLVADLRHLSADARERRDACLVSMADAAVIVWDDPALRRLLQLVEVKGIPVHLISAPTKQKARRVRGPEEATARRGMLPD